MRTPAGTECRHYYEDFNRGRAVQECRLIKYNPDSLPWRPTYCRQCPVPAILNANASPLLELELTVRPVLLGLGRRLVVEAACSKHHISVPDPYVGCPECNAERPGLNKFLDALGIDDDEDRTAP
jgi:hypothetical protein